MTEKLVKNFKEDFKKLRHLFPSVKPYDATPYWQQKKTMGERGLICFYIGDPGF